MDKITFVLLGATGDLTTRKLLPAIYHLVEKKKLTSFAIVGAARSKYSITNLINDAKKFVPKGKKKIWDIIRKRSTYCQLDFYNEGEYNHLATTIRKIEKQFNLPARRIFYLATLPDHFETITQNIAKYKLSNHKRGWPRVVYEKPFGHNLKSAKKLNKDILQVFEEDHIYRIDHYLGKELVENIMMVRFTNRILNTMWNSKHIESIQIVLDETLDVQERAEYFDAYGVLKDMVQNHILQLFSLVTMQEPACLGSDSVRLQKVRILKRVVIQDMLIGQYEGYRKTKGIHHNSTTPTFAALKLKIKHPSWKNIPIFCKTGKALRKKQSYIDIKFKGIPCKLTRGCPSDTNHFRIQLAPDEGMFLQINNKIPGEKLVKPINLSLDLCQEFGPNSPEAYENILEQVALGNKVAFVSQQEVEYSWRIIDNVLKTKWPLYSYQKKSNGPVQLENWSRKQGVVWQE